jgi:hypothetical protein
LTSDLFWLASTRVEWYFRLCSLHFLDLSIAF